MGIKNGLGLAFGPVVCELRCFDPTSVSRNDWSMGVFVTDCRRRTNHLSRSAEGRGRVIRHRMFNVRAMLKIQSFDNLSIRMS